MASRYCDSTTLLGGTTNINKKYDLSAPQGVRDRNADITLARKILGWEPRVSLEEGLAKTYEWIAYATQQSLPILLGKRTSWMRTQDFLQ